PSFDFGRSRTCPIDAFTRYFESRYFWIVLTLVGDSTTTSDRFATPSPLSSCPDPNEPLSLDPADLSVQLQRQEERGGPSGGHSPFFVDLAHRHRCAAQRAEPRRRPAALAAAAAAGAGGHATPGRRHAIPPAGRHPRHDVLPALHQRRAVANQRVGS